MSGLWLSFNSFFIDTSRIWLRSFPSWCVLSIHSLLIPTRHFPTHGQHDHFQFILYWYRYITREDRHKERYRFQFILYWYAFRGASCPAWGCLSIHSLLIPSRARPRRAYRRCLSIHSLLIRVFLCVMSQVYSDWTFNSFFIDTCASRVMFITT